MEEVDGAVKSTYHDNADMIVEKNHTIAVTQNAKYTSNNTDLESATPMGIKGSEVQLGGGNLRPYWDGEKGIWDAVTCIPAIPIPLCIPAPPLICMTMEYLKKAIAALDSQVKTINEQLLK
jgi:hypothetical protein